LKVRGTLSAEEATSIAAKIWQRWQPFMARSPQP
jgi:hypothetical protein